LEALEERPGDEAGDDASGDHDAAQQGMDRPHEDRADEEHDEVVDEEPELGDRVRRFAHVLAGQVHELACGDAAAHAGPGLVEVVGEAPDDDPLARGVRGVELPEAEHPERRLRRDREGHEPQPECEGAAVAGDQPVVDDPAEHPQSAHRGAARDEVEQGPQRDAAGVAAGEGGEEAQRGVRPCRLRRPWSGGHGSQAYRPTGFPETA